MFFQTNVSSPQVWRLLWGLCCVLWRSWWTWWSSPSSAWASLPWLVSSSSWEFWTRNVLSPTVARTLRPTVSSLLLPIGLCVVDSHLLPTGTTWFSVLRSKGRLSTLNCTHTFCREFPHSLSFSGEGKSQSHVHKSNSSSLLLPHWLGTVSWVGAEGLDLAKGNQAVPRTLALQVVVCLSVLQRQLFFCAAFPAPGSDSLLCWVLNDVT